MSLDHIIYPAGGIKNSAQINISNYNYGKYYNVSFYSGMYSSSSFSSFSVSKIKSEPKNSKNVDQLDSNDQVSHASAFHNFEPLDVAALDTSTGNGNNNIINTRTISKTYQKYRTLLSLPKKNISTSSLTASSSDPEFLPDGSNLLTLMSLPDEILSLILSFVYVQLERETQTGKRFSFLKLPFDQGIYKPKKSKSSESHNINNDDTRSSLTRQKPKNVQFRLISSSTNSSATMPLNTSSRLIKDHFGDSSDINTYQKKINRPVIPIDEYNSLASQKKLINYVNTILKNYKKSAQNYTSFPDKTLLCLIYVNKRFYSLTIPFLYRNLTFRSSYRFSQFVSTIYETPKLGVFVKSINFEFLDNLYYFVTDKSDIKNGYLILSEKEKNQLEHLMNDKRFQNVFDGRFHNDIDMSQVPCTRINVKEYISANNNCKLPILLMHGEKHSLITNPINTDGLIELGVKPRIALCGWREWKLRDDPLYQTSKVSVDWVTQYVNTDLGVNFYDPGFLPYNFYQHHYQSNGNISSYSSVRNRSNDSITYKAHVSNDESLSTRRQNRRGSIGNLSIISMISLRSNGTTMSTNSNSSIFSNSRDSNLSSFSSLENISDTDHSYKDGRMVRNLKIKSKMKHISKKISGKIRTIWMDPDTKLVEFNTKLNTKANANTSKSSNYGTCNNRNKKKVASSKNLSKAENSCSLSFHNYPVRNKSLMKYSVKDVPLGHLLHVLDICCNLEHVNLDRILIADDYLITDNYTSSGASAFPLLVYPQHNNSNYRPMITVPPLEDFDFDGEKMSQMFDKNRYLSDVRTFYALNDSQLTKIKVNECIFSRLNKLEHMKSLSMSRLRWVTTGDILQMFKENQSIRSKKLQFLNFKDSGMQRELKWAVEGSANFVWDRLYNVREQEMLTLSRRIGREY